MSSYFRIASFTFALLLILLTPIFAADEKPQIFINSASNIGIVTGTNLGLSKFSQYARQAGFDINHGVHPDLVSGSPLEGIDVYIFFDPNIPFTDPDKIALRQWVRAGGILITADFQPNSSMIGRFLEEFGVESTQRIVGLQDLVVPNGSPLAGPRSLSSLVTGNCWHIRVIDKTKSEAIVLFENGDVAAARTLGKNTGKGEIIAFSCLTSLFDSNVGGAIDLADNNDLVRNLLTYIKGRLSGSSDESYDLSLLNLKFKKGSTFVPGEEIKFVAKIRNIGTQAGEATRIAFYIEKTGSAPSAKMEVASATVAAIGAKKKIKIVKKAFLPDGLEAGTYEITAIIDPDELTDDANTGNNSEAAKKKIVVQ